MCKGYKVGKNMICSREVVQCCWSEQHVSEEPEMLSVERGSKDEMGKALLILPRWPIGCTVMLPHKTQTWREIQSILQGTIVSGIT